MAKRALIVDDSRTAQVRLRKMLEKFELEVDTAMSAEEALGYLSYRQPAVIFLDHHMEGMDGLEALRIIKSNPATALVPVIMYTSEQGDVYVGQARALGAIDILGKEVMKHASLEKVLGGLGIRAIEGAAGESEASPSAIDRREHEPVQASREAFTPMDYTAASDEIDSGELSQVQRQISRLFEIHITKVRQEIEDSSKFLFRRLSKEIAEKTRNAKPRSETVGKPAPEGVVPAMEPEPPASGRQNSWLPWFMAASVAALGFLVLNSFFDDRRIDLLADQLTRENERAENEREITRRLINEIAQNNSDRFSAKIYADRQILLDAMSWAMNADTQVAFGEIALGDQRIYMVGEMLGLLKAADFNGLVFIDVHAGNFCVIQDPSGQLMLPEPESNVEECIFLASEQPEVLIGEQTSIGFLNYLQSAPILSEGNIEIELSSQNYSNPRYSYPPVTSATSAGDWNRVAQKNNRISVSFSAN